MSKFTSKMIVSPLSNGVDWVLRCPLSYDVMAEGSGETIIVPTGFITDFASVPRMFWRVYPKWGKYGQAAVLHDWLYWAQLPGYPREYADHIFYEAMLVLDVNKRTTDILYRAVRMFGKRAWDDNAKAKIEGKTKMAIICRECEPVTIPALLI